MWEAFIYGNLKIQLRKTGHRDGTDNTGKGQTNETGRVVGWWRMGYSGKRGRRRRPADEYLEEIGGCAWPDNRPVCRQ
jgi:hypothetical protein